MCLGGSSPPPDNSAARARREEERRQRDIKLGQSLIDATFDGGEYIHQYRAVDPEASMQQPGTLDEEPSTGRFGIELPQGGGRGRNAARRNQQFTGRVLQGNTPREFEPVYRTKEAAFGPEFFQAIRDAYINYQNPELDRKYTDAQRQLGYGLARKGIHESTAANDTFGRAAELYGKQRVDIENQGADEANQMRNRVEQTRSDLMALNQASADPQMIASQTSARIGALNAPQTFSPIGDAFAGLVNNAAFQYGVNQRYAPASGGRSLFAPSAGGSGTVVR
jgi:hypothetical protein